MTTVNAFSLAICLFVTLMTLWHIHNESHVGFPLGFSALAGLQLFLGLT